MTTYLIVLLDGDCINERKKSAKEKRSNENVGSTDFQQSFSSTVLEIEAVSYLRF